MASVYMRMCPSLSELARSHGALSAFGLAVIALSAFGLAISFVLPFVLSQQKSAFDRCVPPVSLSLLRMIEMRLTFQRLIARLATLIRFPHTIGSLLTDCQASYVPSTNRQLLLVPMS